MSVFDLEGNRYLDPNKPSLDQISRIQAREEDLKQEILQQLDWINDVRVSVQMVAPPSPNPQPAPPTVPESPVAASEPSVGVNQPLDTETVAAPRRTTGPSRRVEAPVEATFARILVRVPRSFYYHRAVPSRNLSQEELRDDPGADRSQHQDYVGVSAAE